MTHKQGDFLSLLLVGGFLCGIGLLLQGMVVLWVNIKRC